MDMTWLLRMARWLRHPPSPRHVKLVLGVAAIAIAIVVVEHYMGWPDALTLDRMPRQP